MNLLLAPVMVGLMELTLFASCVNLCSNLSLAAVKMGLNIPLKKTEISRTGNTPHNIGHQERKEWHVVFKT